MGSRSSRPVFHNSKGQGVIGILVFFVGTLVISWMLGRQLATTTAGPKIVACIAGGAIVLLTFVKPDAGFIVLIFSMLLSPELRVGGVPQRAVVVRVEDVLIFLVFITWWARLAMRRELGLLRHTPLHAPLLIFLVVCGLATALGIMTGSVTSPKASFFYLLKYTEYFLVYFMFASQLRTPQQLRWYLVATVITAVIIGGYGYWQMHAGPGRISAPFEGEKAEPNTLAGYLILMFGVIGGLILKLTGNRWRLMLLGIWCFLIPPFLMTYSRGAYLAFIAMYLTFLALVRGQQRLFLACLLIVALFVVPHVLPRSVVDRIMYTFTSRSRIEVVKDRLAIDPSAAQRIKVWPTIFNSLKGRPLLGYGVTGVGLVDEQYALVLGETGIIGFMVYLWTRWLLWWGGLTALRTTNDPLSQGLALGFLAGFAGLLIHSFAGNIFIIVRIMEPFWCLAAMVMILPALSQQTTTT